MIQPIMQDQTFLQKKSTMATIADQQTVGDLIATLMAHRDNCLGMAANMIGVTKRIIVVAIGPLAFPMVNPVITHRQAPFAATETCLAVHGEHQATRYQTITVNYQDQQMATHTQKFTGLTAQVIQHEMDHFEGILI